MKQDPTPNHESLEARINREASEWIAKQDQGFTPQEQDAFFEWLAEDPKHGEIYHARTAIWRNLNKLAEWRPEHSKEPNPDLLARSRRRAKPSVNWITACAAIAAVVVLGLFLSQQQPLSNPSNVIRLASAEGAHSYEYHILEDGSIVELNRGAQASVQFTDEHRLIHLFSGEAYFTVAKDPNRPFEVRVRGTVVKALGTIFNVSLTGEKVEVFVTEGRVQMNSPQPIPQEIESEVKDPLAWELSAGQLSVLELDTALSFPVVEEVSQEEISRRLSWKNELLDFSAAPLSQVVLEFNRRNHTQIILEDPSLADRKITAALKPYNIDGFMQLLELTMDVEVVPLGDATILLRSKER